MTNAQFYRLFLDACKLHGISHWDSCTESCFVGKCDVTGGTGTAPTINKTQLTYNPTPTGNANDRHSFVKALNGNTYYIDGDGDAILLDVNSSASITPFTFVISKTSGDTVTVPFPPLASSPILVFRNGLRCNTSEYVRAGYVFTFVRPFGVSPGAIGSETITIDFSI